MNSGTRQTHKPDQIGRHAPGPAAAPPVFDFAGVG